MAPDRKLTGPSAAAEAYPTGAVLLGELRDAVNIPLTSITARTAARVAAGETVDERGVVELCCALSKALVDKGVAPPIEDALELLTMGIYSLIKKWDLATAPLRVGEPKSLDWSMMTMAGAQLFAVELGIRAGAWLAMTSSVADIVPISNLSRGAIMDTAINATKLSQGKLARELHVDEKTIVRWRRGESRPDDRQLDALGTYLPPETVAGVRRALSFAAIMDRLAVHLPEGFRVDLWTGLSRVFAASRAFHAEKPHDLCVRTVVFGPDAAPELVALLLAGLSDAEFHWRAPIDSAVDWAARLEFVHGVAWRAAMPGIPPALHEIVFWKAFGEASPAIAQIAAILVRAHPDLADLVAAYQHLFEAAVARRQYRVADAVHHLRQAHALLPDDAGVTRAVIDGLLQAGEPDEAILRTVDTPAGIAKARQIWAAKQIAANDVNVGLAEFEALLREGDTHPEMYLYVGVARFRAGDFVGALDALEHVVADERFEHHALALDIAATCAYELGKVKRGDELARRANQVGVSRSYLRRLVRRASDAPSAGGDKS